MAIQADGKIVVVGSAWGNEIVVARYNADGSLDTSFGVGGTAIADFGGWNYAFSVAIDGEGRIVVAGEADESSFALLRFNADGSLDTTFGAAGVLVTTFPVDGDSLAYSVKIDADDRILVTGSVAADGQNDILMARYLSNGSLDPSFGAGGEVVTSIVGGALSFSAAIDSQGRIVVAGLTCLGSSWTYVVVRYTPDGQIDPGFDDGSPVIGSVVCVSESGCSLVIDADDRIVVASCVLDDIVLVRYDTDGSLDSGFGADGLVSTDVVAPGGDGQCVALQSDGKLVVAGGDGSGDFALARYNADGTADASLYQSVTTTYQKEAASRTSQNKSTRGIELLATQ